MPVLGQHVESDIALVPTGQVAGVSERVEFYAPPDKIQVISEAESSCREVSSRVGRGSILLTQSMNIWIQSNPRMDPIHVELWCVQSTSGLCRATMERPVDVPHDSGRRRRRHHVGGGNNRPVQRRVRRPHADEPDLGQPGLVARAVNPQRNVPPVHAVRCHQRLSPCVAQQKSLLKVR